MGRNNMGSKQKNQQNACRADLIHAIGLDFNLMLSIIVMTKTFELDIWIYKIFCINSGVTLDALIPVGPPISL